jgi:hypothetical protein
LAGYGQVSSELMIVLLQALDAFCENLVLGSRAKTYSPALRLPLDSLLISFAWFICFD